jgi:hypothetical protein
VVLPSRAEQPARIRRHRTGQLGEQSPCLAAQRVEPPRLLVQLLQVRGEHLGEQCVVGRVGQHTADLLQRHAELSQQPDLVEPVQVGLGVAAVAGLCAPARPEQAKLVVVMQRPHRHPGDLGQRADAPPHWVDAPFSAHDTDHRTSRYVRFNTDSGRPHGADFYQARNRCKRFHPLDRRQDFPE